MITLKHEVVPIRNQNDVVLVRQKVRLFAVELGFSLLEQTKVITAASELARNTLDYGLGGDAIVEAVRSERPGLRMIFVDQGPGIANVALALTDGYTSGGGLGMGLSGAKRLVTDFEIETEVGKGTRVTAIKWK